MADEWYYAHDANKIGPLSGWQLKNLAALGNILSTDTIWKDGVEKGVLACKVKNLFSFPPVSVPVPLEKVAVLSQMPASAPFAATVLPIIKSESSPPPPAEVFPAEVPPSGNSAFSVDLAILGASSQRKPVAKSIQPRVAPKPASKGRAVAVKGADIVSQDGITAKYRRKCTECGHKDEACQTITISNKTTKAGYYCPKCRKKRDVAIRCTLW